MTAAESIRDGGIKLPFSAEENPNLERLRDSVIDGDGDAYDALYGVLSVHQVDSRERRQALRDFVATVSEEQYRELCRLWEDTHSTGHSLDAFADVWQQRLSASTSQKAVAKQLGLNRYTVQLWSLVGAFVSGDDPDLVGRWPRVSRAVDVSQLDLVAALLIEDQTYWEGMEQQLSEVRNTWLESLDTPAQMRAERAREIATDLGYSMPQVQESLVASSLIPVIRVKELDIRARCRAAAMRRALDYILIAAREIWEEPPVGPIIVSEYDQFWQTRNWQHEGLEVPDSNAIGQRVGWQRAVAQALEGQDDSWRKLEEYEEYPTAESYADVVAAAKRSADHGVDVLSLDRRDPLFMRMCLVDPDRMLTPFAAALEASPLSTRAHDLASSHLAAVS